MLIMHSEGTCIKLSSALRMKNTSFAAFQSTTRLTQCFRVVIKVLVLLLCPIIQHFALICVNHVPLDSVEGGKLLGIGI